MKLKNFWERTKEMMGNEKVVAGWGVVYVAFLLFTFVLDYRESYFALNYAFADMFINYSGGFVRRGLLGQLYLDCSQVGISPVLAAAATSTFAYLVIAIFMIRQFRQHRYNPWILTVGWLLGGMGLYGLTFMRRDYIIVCLFLFVVWLWKKVNTNVWIMIANVILCFGTLCYEPFALFAVPFCVLLTRLRLKNWFKSLACWILPTATFFVCCKYVGGKEAYEAIVASTSEFLPSPGIIEFFTMDSTGVMKTHISMNFLEFRYGIPNVLVSIVSLTAVVYYCINAIPTFTGNKQDFVNRRYLLAILLCAFFVLSPMFTCLSTDYSRTCIYVCLSSFFLFFALSEQELKTFLPNFIYTWADRLLTLSDKHLRPTRFKIMFIMLFIGVPAVTKWGMKGLLGRSEMGEFLNRSADIICSHFFHINL